MITEDSRVRAPRIIRDQETPGRAGPDGGASETGGMNETGVALNWQPGLWQFHDRGGFRGEYGH